MRPPVLELIDVDKVYGFGRPNAVRAVEDLSLTVNEGEIVALLGSSGCGKTSTLRMVAGFEGVTKGKIKIAGREIQHLPPAKRGVAMAFEGYSLYPPLTVRENIAFALKSQRISPDEAARRVAEIAELMEISDVLERYPASISGGQQQRASLARALVRDADLHLLDEPMGQLEPQLRALLRGRIKHFIHERRLTAILVTHDQTEANALADRIAVMEEGILQQYDTPAKLKDRPANLFTGTFIGEPPMNVFPARVSSSERETVFDLGSGVSLKYPAAIFPPDLRSRLSQESDVCLGIRPHAVRLVDGGLPVTVSVVQWLGDQTHIAAQFASRTLVSVIHDRARFAPGNTASIAISAEDLHIFDADTGVAIGHGKVAA
ncbi:MAG: ABC transporter ATP-binding protein [Roseibium sp.]|nr:ABC transporter ATP-binding protein [Roseibium sp.]